MTTIREWPVAVESRTASPEGDSLALEVTSAVRSYLQRQGISQGQLAQRLGVTPGRVSQVLNGGQNLTLRTMEAIAEVLDARFEVALLPRSEG